MSTTDRAVLTPVLVVEDNDVNRRILVTMLKRSVSLACCIPAHTLTCSHANGPKR